MAGEASSINAHYGQSGLAERIFNGLRAAGKDPERLTLDDLTPFDQLHIRGRDATLELAGLAELRAGQHVLDVGGGLGGPARTLAQEIGCRVTVLDLTEEFCRVGELLTARTGLSDRVVFHHGNALAMPFDAASFDVVWTQHSTMNIPDKELLYAEIQRVLRPDGRLAMHEIMAGPVQPIHYPVPWAPDPSISFLQTAAEVRALLRASGFAEVAWNDVSQPALAWFRERAAAMAAAPPTAPPGLQVALGPQFAEAFRNVSRGVEEQRLVVIEAVCDRA